MAEKPEKTLKTKLLTVALKVALKVALVVVRLYLERPQDGRRRGKRERENPG